MSWRSATEVYREAAPGFSNAFLMLGAPQIGVRHSRRLVGLRKVTRQQWDTGHVWDDEIGVSPSLVAEDFPTYRCRTAHWCRKDSMAFWARAGTSPAMPVRTLSCARSRNAG